MKVKVLGPGCDKCKKLYAEVQKAVAASGLPVDVEKVEKIADMIDLGVTLTPALIIDGEIRCSGRVPAVPEILSWIMTAAARSA